MKKFINYEAINRVEDFKNPDGKTYDGAGFLAALSGLDKAEIMWMADRLKHLMHVEKLSKEAAKEIVSKEGKTKPWIT